MMTKLLHRASARGIGIAAIVAAVVAGCAGDSPLSSDAGSRTLVASLAGTTPAGARVKTNGTVNVRSGPALRYALTGTQPAGAAGTIVAGPVVDATGDKLVRWQVNFDTGADGWAADLYLDSIPAPVAPAKFAAGARVAVSPEQANIRSAATGSATLAGTQPVGALGVVKAGPVTDTNGDKLVRYQVDFDGGVDGWAAQDYLAASTAPVPPARIVVTPDTGTIITGQTLQLAAVAYDAAGATLQNVAMSWTSMDTLKAKVTAAGLVTAAATGTVLIIANGGGKADTAVMNVAAVPVASVSVTPATGALLTGDSLQLAVTLKDAGGAILTGRSVTWASSNAAAATVSPAGLVRAVGAGSATITATSGASGTAAFTVTTPVVMRNGWYVSPTGTATGNGTHGNPWNFATAASGAAGRIQPGDTVWLRGGTYRGPFRVTVSGAAGAPVVFRQYPGERAVIDGAGTSSSVSVFYVGGPYTTFAEFEITNSDPVRTTTSTANNVRPNVVSNYASHTRYYGLIVHDGGVAFYNEPQYGDVEITGCVIYNNGWQGPDRGHGHALYLKSNSGPVVARDNIIFNQFGYGVHLYSNAGSGQLNNIRLDGNVSFNNGTISTSGTSANILLGGGDRASGDVLLNNFTFFSPGLTGTNVQIGYGTLLNGDVQVSGNTFVGGAPVLSVGFWTAVTMQANAIVGSGALVTLNDPSAAAHVWSGNSHHRDPLAGAWRFGGVSLAFDAWRTATGLASSDIASSGVPTTTQVHVRPVSWEPGRANVIVYNWGRQGSIMADLSGVLLPGDRYEIRNAQALFGPPVVSGTYAGGSVSIPMTGVLPPAPVGYATSRAPKTGPDFDVFVVRKM